MSDLADAVFSGQLLGHVIAGQELTTSVIADAAMTASLADGLAVSSDESLTDIEKQILGAKVAETVLEDGHYGANDIIHDQLDSQLDADFAEGFMI
jgi:hypothetical protein